MMSRASSRSSFRPREGLATSLRVGDYDFTQGGQLIGRQDEIGPDFVVANVQQGIGGQYGEVLTFPMAGENGGKGEDVRYFVQPPEFPVQVTDSVIVGQEQAHLAGFAGVQGIIQGDEQDALQPGFGDVPLKLPGHGNEDLAF